MQDETALPQPAGQHPRLWAGSKWHFTGSWDGMSWWTVPSVSSLPHHTQSVFVFKIHV